MPPPSRNTSSKQGQQQVLHPQHHLVNAQQAQQQFQPFPQRYPHHMAAPGSQMHLMPHSCAPAAYLHPGTAHQPGRHPGMAPQQGQQQHPHMAYAVPPGMALAMTPTGQLVGVPSHLLGAMLQAQQQHMQQHGAAVPSDVLRSSSAHNVSATAPVAGKRKESGDAWAMRQRENDGAAASKAGAAAGSESTGHWKKRRFLSEPGSTR
jgi:hypothetical protein